jgi:Reverse transcriptase (RNA-dependent DNA polymerase)
MRMCVDYRALNKITVKNSFPIPRPDELLDATHGAKVFSPIELRSSYHQIRIRNQDVPKTVSNTQFGHLVMTFGLCNVPATWATLMNDIFRPHTNKFLVVYIDDILVFNCDLDEHEQHLRQVLTLLREYKLYGKVSKCSFFKDEIKFLGHVCSKNGIKTSPSKCATILDWPTPMNVHELRSFLGLANYYRQFIHNFAKISAPLTDLLRKDTNFQWTSETRIILNEIKNA